MKVFNRSKATTHILHQPTGATLDVKPGAADIPESFANLFTVSQFAELGLEFLSEINDTAEPLKAVEPEKKEVEPEVKKLHEVDPPKEPLPPSINEGEPKKEKASKLGSRGKSEEK